jgi:YfiH family protein
MHELTLGDCIVPQWPASPGVKALVTTRAGGVSTGPYATLNLGFATSDEDAAVRENRRRLDTLLPQKAHWLRQVHGAKVVSADTAEDRPQADASIALKAGRVCAILIADCLPVLFTNREGSIVAAAHAGWRGLAAGVIENTVAGMRSNGIREHDVLAYIGPGIGPSAFEVGHDVHEAFTKRSAASAKAFSTNGNGKWLANLCMLCRQALERCGVTEIYGGDLCTYSDPERFYSYRRDKVTGRMAALIWREW